MSNKISIELDELFIDDILEMLPKEIIRSKPMYLLECEKTKENLEYYAEKKEQSDQRLERFSYFQKQLIKYYGRNKQK